MVDSDLAVRNSLVALLSAHGYVVKSFTSAGDLLQERELVSQVGCIVIDLSLPETNGHELFAWLEESKCLLSVVVTTGLFDVPPEFWTEPFLSPPLAKPYEASALLKMVADGVAGSLSRKGTRDRRQKPS